MKIRIKIILIFILMFYKYFKVCYNIKKEYKKHEQQIFRIKKED